MKRLRKSLIDLTVASVVGLGVTMAGTAAERKTELSVTYDPPRLSVEARGVSLQRVLGEIGQKLGFVVVDYGGSDRLITFSLQDASAAEVLEQLLRGENYAVVYEGQRKEIAKVLLLTSAMQASTESRNPPYTDMRQERIVQSQAGLTYYSPVSQPSLSVEQKRADKAQPEVRVEDIMRAHALSGMIDPMGSLSGASNVAQPFGSPAGSSFSTGTMSTSPPPQDIHETLAVTTRLAQQNVKALVDGLATASNSLFQSLSNSER
jgi:hypothetical protein